MIFELQRAQRMCDPLHRIRKCLRDVVHGIDAPGAAGHRVRCVHDPVDHRVPEVHVGRGHVDLRPQHVGPFLELAGAHAREEIEVLRHRPGPVRAVASRLGQGAPAGADLLGSEAAHVGVARLDESHRVVEQGFEVVGGVPGAITPVEPEPANVGLNLLDEVGAFPGRIRVVEPQATDCSRIIARNAEVQANRLCVPDVQIPVRLRRKSRHDRLRYPSRRDVGVDRLTDEVGGHRVRRRRTSVLRLSHPGLRIDGPAHGTDTAGPAIRRVYVRSVAAPGSRASRPRQRGQDALDPRISRSRQRGISQMGRTPRHGSIVGEQTSSRYTAPRLFSEPARLGRGARSQDDEHSP